MSLETYIFVLFFQSAPSCTQSILARSENEMVGKVRYKIGDIYSLLLKRRSWPYSCSIMAVPHGHNNLLVQRFDLKT